MFQCHQKEKTTELHKRCSHLASARSSGCASSSERIHASCEGEDAEEEAAPPRLPVEESAAALAGIAASEEDVDGDVDIDFLQSLLSCSASFKHSAVAASFLMGVKRIERRVVLAECEPKYQEADAQSEKQRAVVVVVVAATGVVEKKMSFFLTPRKKTKG